MSSGRIKRPKKVVEDFISFKTGDTLQSITKFATEETLLPLWSDYTVFVGSIKKKICIQKIAQNVEWDGQSPDENYDEVAIAALNFSKDGKYVSSSLSISPLAWAMKKLSGGTANASQKLSIDEYNSDARAIEEQITVMFKPEEENGSELKVDDAIPTTEIVSYELLKKIENMIREELGLKASDMQSLIAVYFKLYASEEDIEDDESGLGLRLDFYSSDLAFAADGLRQNVFSKEKEKLLLDYILGLDRYGKEAFLY